MKEIKNSCFLIVPAVLSLLSANARPAADAPPATVEELAVKSGKTVNQAPGWTKGGAFVYRILTPDTPNVLPLVEQGLAITNHLLDGSVHQIPIINGLIGHDHLGACNWDGLWPYWDRVTFRAGDWKALDDFMRRAKDRDNTSVSFHVNLTDVNAGLRDYPETLAFFQKLAATGSMYRRDRNPITGEHDIEPPYVPRQIPADAKEARQIIAIVNYKNFWDSGLAKEMIDNFYSHLPFPPPLLYVDVLSLTGGDLNVGFPTGPLGGSKQTQTEGLLNIAAYINGKGTSVAAEGDRPFLVGKGVTYGWLHCVPGYSTDDYAYIAGAARYVPLQQVAGNTGCFDVSPVTWTPDALARMRRDYANLLAGKPDAKKMPGLETWHIADRTGKEDEFDIIPGTDGKPGIGGDAFRGDLADLIDNFYLVSIQELYHIGKGNVRTAAFVRNGVLHISKFGLIDPDGKESFVDALEIAPGIGTVKKSGAMMLGQPVEFRFNAPRAGKYQLELYGGNPGNGSGALNVYVNGELRQSLNNIRFPSRSGFSQPVPLGEITLEAGGNTLGFDAGPIYMRWSDGTTALWSTPYLRKGFKVTNGGLTYADDYDRMWPDTWSGQKKIYFFSWDGATRAWKLPPDWAAVHKATLYPLTPDGRDAGVELAITGETLFPKLLPRLPYVLVPGDD